MMQSMLSKPFLEMVAHSYHPALARLRWEKHCQSESNLRYIVSGQPVSNEGLENSGAHML